MKKEIFLSGSLLILIFFAMKGFAEEIHWAHDHQAEWGSIQHLTETRIPEMYPFATCSIGQRQSPVDLSIMSNQHKTNRLRIHYLPDHPVFFNSGHGVQVNTSENYAGKLVVGHEDYSLIQFHFHEPSEHVIGDQSFPAELHFVHVRDDGKIAVLGVLIGLGKENSTLQSILDNIPSEAGESRNDESINIHPEKLLPRNKRRVFSLAGSLTTPPCSEGVDWYILMESITISEAQLLQLKALYSENARLPQNLNGRVVTHQP